METARYREDEPDGNATGKSNNGVTEIPLFPLTVVLFPFMVLPLHIFEERYREMIRRCIDEQSPFGIVLVRGVNEDTGRVETYPVGCTARILRVEKLPDGRMNIAVVGDERFRILDTHEEYSYRSALIEPYADDIAERAALEPAAEEVSDLLQEYLIRYLTAHGQGDVEFELPTDPQHLSFIAACVMPLENESKQVLLMETDILARLVVEREVLRKEITRLREAAESQQVIWKPLEPGVFEQYLSPN